MSILEKAIQVLRDSRRDLDTVYQVPGLWVDHDSPAAVEVNPHDFYAEKLESILISAPIDRVGGNGNGDWTRRARVYNLFPRVTAAFDHNADGVLSIAPEEGGWRETGTLLKSIAMLPYIQSLGVNTVHLLPITSVGQDGKKGTLGSPYAIRNPYELDANLAEPAVALSVDELFLGFVEAAHRLGLRVVMEFVLRTASKDADWIREHPEWFYWIREEIPDRMAGRADSSAFGIPIFSAEKVQAIRNRIFQQQFENLPAPPKSYRAMYTAPPQPDQVWMEDGHWVGRLADGTRVRVPGAFTDWPVDDNQPPWSDVTYLRFYEHPKFNYMAYNTLRMYDSLLARPEHQVHELWEAVIGVIPYYQQTFGIDGVMIDMGHALPQPLKERIVQAAREIDPDFAFWDENFMIESGSLREGYNAVMGYLVFDFHVGDRFKGFLQRLEQGGVPLPYFITAENHNTPRAYSRPFPLEYVHYVLALSVMLPGVFFIHSGFELMETKPINTGLGFSSEMIQQHPVETLPLFSEWAFNWTRESNLVGSIRYAMQLRQTYEDLLSDLDPATFSAGYSSNPALFGIARQRGNQTLLAVASASMGTLEQGRVYFPAMQHTFELEPLWGGDVPQWGVHTVYVDVTLDNGRVLLLDGGTPFAPLGK